MYCPQCAQKQATEDVRFCSRCGLPLTEVTGLLARRGEVEEPRNEASPLRKGLKQSGYIFLAVVALLIILVNGDANGDYTASVVLIGLAIAALRAIYAVAFQRGKTARPAPAPIGLPPGDRNPVAIPRTQFDTGEIVMEPPSVTEHTTRHLEQERPHDRRRERE